MSKIRLTVRVLLVAIAATITLGGVVALVGHHQRSKADRLLRDLYQMKLDSATFQTARDLTTRNGGHSVGACSRDKCRFDVSVRNKIFQWLRLARPKEFVVSLFVSNDRVSRISFGVVCSPSNIEHYPLGTGVSVTDQSCYPCFEGQDHPFLAKQNGVDPARPMQIVVELTGASTLEQRRAAYALDLSCLSEFGDCPRPDRTAPAIWQEIKPGNR